MKIFTTYTKKVVIITFILTLLFSHICYGETLTRSQLENMIDEISMERGVPSVLIKAIAHLESGFNQFRSDGRPLVSYSGNHVGLMQVSQNSIYDANRLKYDVEYNINAGIDILLQKWNSSASRYGVAKVGNMDPNIIENWYFAIWAYNGWSGSNNPNANAWAYQNRIYKICRDHYDTTITHIDSSQIPSRGNPGRGTVVSTPNKVNYAKIVQYNVKDIVAINSISGTKELYSEPGGSFIKNLPDGQMAEIMQGPILKDGFYWYKIKLNDNTSGWVERNWIRKVGDSTYGVYPFDDIVYHWCASSVMDLYNNKFLSGKTADTYCPDDIISVQDFIALFSKATGLDTTNVPNNDSRFEKSTTISQWAKPYFAKLDSLGLLNIYANNVDGQKPISRGEMTCIVAKYLTSLGIVSNSDITLPFKDIDKLADWQINNIKLVYSNKIINGQNSENFGYGSFITRGGAACVVDNIKDLIKDAASLDMEKPLPWTD